MSVASDARRARVEAAIRADSNKQFTVDVTLWARFAGVSVTTAIRKITMDLFTDVIFLTPVLTGRARHNWVASVGRQDTTTTEEVDPEGLATAARMMSVVGTYSGVGSVYLSNSLSYIRLLEYGWSRKAPQGMVRLTVRNFRRIVNNAMRELNRGFRGGRSR